ncbi:30S ribosomal protein S9, mitochondrial [Nymphaea colorata]|nr:30S ribosomal protein S9, mitochondrial [Nymphaea colorata]XP_031484355.1 30S ribosomal protein S9, mitochondrial [Nymphaea colorata]XP_049933606.1 30S ribosomal protein S9, mitochondrial [Nymphaea colorata]
MMITRLFRASAPFKTLTVALAASRRPLPFLAFSRTFSSNEKGGNGGKSGGSSNGHGDFPKSWSFSAEDGDGDEKLDIFREIKGNGGEEKLSGLGEHGDRDLEPPPRLPSGILPEGEAWDAAGLKEESETKEGDIFKEAAQEIRPERSGGDDEWETAEGFKPWTFGDDDEEGSLGSDFAAIPEGIEGIRLDEEVGLEGAGLTEEDKRIQKEEAELSATLKGPNRAFGDLISASGITEAMLDSLIALKDFEGVEGLPPLREIEELRLAKSEKKSSRAEMERQKQEEIAKSYVRKVDEKGRAYGTGKRKCSIARVWIQPGNGNFIINDKQFDVYFPILDYRADLLKPFAETKTLGMWDVKCTVKGGGTSGQAGAIRLGISRALQNWEPGLRPCLRSAGLLTRDPRVVERKKPGKAKARKSFQWVKR